MGSRTLLLTHSVETLGQMSCNPSIGGIGKGTSSRKSTLWGCHGPGYRRGRDSVPDAEFIQGPAVRATRAQADRALYRQAVRRRIENQPNLVVFQQAVDDLLLEGQRVVGVATQLGLRFHAQAVVLTTGTFLAGLIHVGLRNYQAGRAGDPASITLAAKLREMSLPVGRLKTGTPPRLDARSIDFSVLAEQPGDAPEPVFSFMGRRDMHPGSCRAGSLIPMRRPMKSSAAPWTGRRCIPA